MVASCFFIFSRLDICMRSAPNYPYVLDTKVCYPPTLQNLAPSNPDEHTFPFSLFSFIFSNLSYFFLSTLLQHLSSFPIFPISLFPPFFNIFHLSNLSYFSFSTLCQHLSSFPIVPISLFPPFFNIFHLFQSFLFLSFHPS